MDTELQDPIRANEYIQTGESTSRARTPQDLPVAGNDVGAAGPFGSEEAAELRTRWEKIQSEFVDEPRKSVEQADDLVATVTGRLTRMFQDQKQRLEEEWGKGETSTEELRMAFRRYRTLFDRLLSI